MNSKVALLNKISQPLGFVLMLLGLMMSEKLQLLVFCSGTILTWLGIAIEFKEYSRNKKSQKSMGPITFYSGLMIKLVLSISLILRLLETEYSFFILLGCLLLSVLWSVFAFFHRPSALDHEDLLDR